MPHFQSNDLIETENFMYHAGSVPQHHIPPRFFYEIASKVFIWCKNNRLVPGNTLNNKRCITACTDDITQGFDACRTVDIGNHDMVRILFPELPEQFRWSRICKGATCIQIRQQDFLLRIQDLGCFSHKMYARKYDHRSPRLFSLLRQTQTVTNIISYILDIGLLVVMGQYHSVLFLFQSFDLMKQI